MSSKSSLISLRGLSRDFDGLRALGGIDLDVDRGETFGLIGPNGAGKTTLIRILTGLISPTKGEMLVEGKKLDPRHRAYRRRIGLVPQETALYGRLTAGENLVLLARLHGLDRGKAAFRAKELLAWAGLEEHADREARYLSRGMQQRLSLAMGMVHDPEIVFLDEPTSGLDPEARSRVWDLVEKLSGEGKTVFLATHNLEEADRLCDRLAILFRGEIREQGTPEQIKNLLGRDRLELGLAEGALGDLSEICGRLGLSWRKEGRIFVITGPDLPGKLPSLVSRLTGSLYHLHYREVTLEDAFLRFMKELEN